MSLEAAITATEMLLALALLQQSVEHLRPDPVFNSLRIALCAVLVLGLWTPLACLGLMILAIANLHRFNGPYNGGSDRMGLLILISLTLAQLLPTDLAELAFGYLAMQLVLSYFMSGWVKITNPDWRTGRALADVFRFSAYPVSEELRGLAERPKLLWLASWSVMILELAFPMSLLTPWSLAVALILTACFHLANACLFGLNRFLWIWLAAYPSIIWLQDRLSGQ